MGRKPGGRAAYPLHGAVGSSTEKAPDTIGFEDDK
jgi:hypothetical protein